ncbi:MAG: hypothetical protein KC585_02265, partial [Candidatus Magasanikbacteria bacterium]|nr:hypothetical protein [Candidatus Magasanikbacteria bacterium]
MSEMNPFASRGERSVSMFAKPLPRPIEAPPEQIEDLEDRFGIQEYLGKEMSYETRMCFESLVNYFGEDEVIAILESRNTAIEAGEIINLNLSSLESLPKGFTFPEIGGSLYLNNLTSLPEGFTFPEIGGSLCLGRLTSLPEGCTFSEIGGSLYLN